MSGGSQPNLTVSFIENQGKPSNRVYLVGVGLPIYDNGGVRFTVSTLHTNITSEHG